MIGSFINIIGLVIALVVICIECDTRNKIIENTYSFKYGGRYIYDPKELAKRQNITTVIAVTNCVVCVVNLILAIWVGV